MRQAAVFFIILIGLAVGWRVVSDRKYRPETGINLVVAGEDKVALVGIDKNNNSLIWVDLPANLRIDGYAAVSIWGLGEIDRKGEERVMASLGEALGLWFKTAVKVEGEVGVDSLLKRLLSLRGIKSLSWLDRYFLYKDVSFLAGRGIILETSLPYQAIEKIKEVDGYEWSELNETVFVWSRDLWPKEEVMNLGMSAEVINVSGQVGKARVRARQLESVGFRVVRIETGDKRNGKACVVEVDRDVWQRNQFIKQILKNYLECEVKMGEGLVFYVG